MNERGQIQECVALARSSLIRARILQQEAEAEKELHMLYGLRYLMIARPETLQFRAKAQRQSAKEYLELAERFNGKLYFEGGSKAVYPLKTMLNGRNYKAWPEYRNTYSRHWMFRGEDPK